MTIRGKSHEAIRCSTDMQPAPEHVSRQDEEGRARAVCVVVCRTGAVAVTGVSNVNGREILRVHATEWACHPRAARRAYSELQFAPIELPLCVAHTVFETSGRT
jgi:hypothetical protein